MYLSGLNHGRPLLSLSSPYRWFHTIAAHLVFDQPQRADVTVAFIDLHFVSITV